MKITGLFKQYNQRSHLSNIFFIIFQILKKVNRSIQL